MLSEEKLISMCGLRRFLLDSFQDDRGSFIKIINKKSLSEMGVAFEAKEIFYTRSTKGVIRGMHFQSPPAAHMKIVHCSEGEVLDVVLDLRLGSPSNGKCHSVKLTASRPSIFVIPPGFAHGFCVLSDHATVVYAVDSDYAPELDGGIRWDSIPFEWPTNTPTISQRDRNFIKLDEFKTPFFYER